jgi:hypothetical protein
VTAVAEDAQGRKTVSSVRFWILTLLPRLWLRAQVTELQFQPV